MKKENIKANILLMITAIIWGFAFVAQRSSMEHIGPYLFNAARFALGATSLLPVYFLLQWKQKNESKNKTDSDSNPNKNTGKLKALFVWSTIAGLFMFLGSSFQQVGVKYTTAGNAGFITGLYVIIVPIIGIFMGRQTRTQTWIGIVFALVGMYFLSITSGFNIAFGDLLVFISAFFWAGHVQIVGKISRTFDALAISIIQFYICAFLSLVVALFVEPIEIHSIVDAGMPILYTGILSVGVAYTLQVVAQKHAHPSEAAIILSFESVFAVIGGILVLGEVLSIRGGIGCSLMLFGIIFSQTKWTQKRAV